MNQPPRIVLSRFDQERLDKLLTRVGARPDLDALRAEIDRAEVIDERQLTGEVLATRIVALARDRDRRLQMGRAIRTLARLDAAARIADRVWLLAGESGAQ